MTVEMEAAMPATDDQGYLLDPTQWNPAVAEKIAEKESLALTEDHWVAIRFMRGYWERHQIAPDARHVMRHLAETLGPEKAGRNYLFRLFPYGYVQQACKIAGMRKPRAWSTG